MNCLNKFDDTLFLSWVILHFMSTVLKWSPECCCITLVEHKEWPHTSQLEPKMRLKQRWKTMWIGRKNCVLFALEVTGTGEECVEVTGLTRVRPSCRIVANHHHWQTGHCQYFSSSFIDNRI